MSDTSDKQDRRTFLMLAPAALVTSATPSNAARRNTLNIPIGPFANCDEPGFNTSTTREKSTLELNGEMIAVEVSYACRKLTVITLWRPSPKNEDGK